MSEAAEASPDPLADVRAAIALPDVDQRESASAASLRSMVMRSVDELTLASARRLVTAARVLSARECDALIREARELLAGPAEPRRVLRDGGPAYEVRVSQDDWRYSLGDAEWDRGVYKFERARGEAGEWRWLAELPWVHRRIVHRNGSRIRSGTSALMSAEREGPRLVVDSRKIRDGSWASELGVALPAERKTADAVATAIDAMLYDLPPEAEAEAVPAIADDGRVLVPVPECLPGGYLQCSDVLPRSAALEQWAAIARDVADEPNMAAVLSASAGAWVVELAGLTAQSHWLELPGGPGTGKTTTLRLAAAVWGDPGKTGGVVLSWNATARAVGGHLGRLALLPAFYDEMGTADLPPAQWARLVLETTEGDQRSTGERFGDGARRSAPWQGVLFTTGNASIRAGISASRYDGLVRRLLTVAPPFTRSADHAEQLAELLPACYGHLGAELLERFSAADVREMFTKARELLPMPAQQIAHCIARLLHVYVVGALMLDELLGLGELLTGSVLTFGALYLAEHNHELEHIADRVLDAVRESIGREPGRWPTVAEYREARQHQAELIGRPDLPVHGIGGRDLAGVQADDRAWVALFAATWRDEICAPLGGDEAAALAELYARRVLEVPDSLRRSGKWQAPVRLEPKPAPPVRMYKLALPPVEDDDELAEGAELPAVDPAEGPVSGGDNGSIPSRVCGGEGISDGNPGNPPSSEAESHGNPHGNPTVIPAVIPAAEAVCEGCGDVLDAVLVKLGEKIHPSAECERRAAERRAQAEDVDQAPRATVRDRGRPWLVLGGDGRAYAQGGEVLPLPRQLGEIHDVGELTALALELSCRVLWVTRDARELLGLPGELPPLAPREGMPHQFTESADPARWDVWPAEPVGLAGWMQVYRMPSALHEGAALAFAEWLPAIGDGPQLGELPPAELAEALTLVWQSTTYSGQGGRGGVNYARSPGATMRRLLDSASRRRRTGELVAVDMPAPYTRGRGSVLERPPGPWLPPVDGLEPGWLVAEMDVRSCFLSAVLGTDFGVGDAERRYRLPVAEARRLPGAHYVTASADRAQIHPALWPMLPRPRRRNDAEVSAWVDAIALGWLADNGVPLTLGESWCWPQSQGRRVYASVAERLGNGRDALRARGDRPALVAESIVKAMYQRTFGGWLGSDFGGERDPDDPWARVDHWLTVRVQAEVRKQRNLLPAIKSGALVVIGSAHIDTVYVAAQSLEALEAATGAGGKPLLSEQRGKFKLEHSGAVTPGLAAQLARRGAGNDRAGAIAEALGKAGK